MLAKMSKYVERVLKKNMATEQELKNTIPYIKNFKTY